MLRKEQQQVWITIKMKGNVWKCSYALSQSWPKGEKSWDEKSRNKFHLRQQDNTCYWKNG